VAYTGVGVAFHNKDSGLVALNQRGMNFDKGTASKIGLSLSVVRKNIIRLNVLNSVIHQYLFMAKTIFEHLKYQLNQN
jgi:hypothetical protein